MVTRKSGVSPEPAPVSMATAPNLTADIMLQLQSREGGGAELPQTPPTPEPGRGSQVASLPAGPLPSQVVTFPSLVASPGPGLAGA